MAYHSEPPNVLRYFSIVHPVQADLWSLNGRKELSMALLFLFCYALSSSFVTGRPRSSRCRISFVDLDQVVSCLSGHKKEYGRWNADQYLVDAASPQ